MCMNILKKKSGLARCYAQSPTAQDTFWNIPEELNMHDQVYGQVPLSHLFHTFHVQLYKMATETRYHIYKL